MARVRIHQHVNPLAKYFRELPVTPLDPAKVFARPDLPLHLDIGSARGRFLLKMAELQNDWNFLGVEIREPLVHDANKTLEEKGLENLHFEFCNATIDLGELLADLPTGILRAVTIQFPDPWFKKRHAKRRIVKNNLVETLARNLNENGRIILQTDVEFLGDEMCSLFEQSGSFRVSGLVENPLPVKSEREIAVERRNKPVFRFHLKKI